MKNLIYAIFLGLTITSCNWIYKKGPNQQLLLDEEIAKVDWNQVDENPRISKCDSLETNDLKKQCLYDFLVKTTQERFNEEIIPLNVIEIDTVWLALVINTDSTVIARPDLSNLSNEITAQQIEDLVRSKLDTLPKIIPGTKNGIAVKAQYNIPLVLHKK